jgi:hypothetical protein
MSMSSIVAKVNGQIDVKVRKATLELFGAVIKATPVDTGRAKNNWQCTIGSPASGELEEVDKTGSRAIARVYATVPQKIGSIVWLTNNVPYIRKLEYGSSKQAGPNVMVRDNVMRFAGILRSA